MRRGRSHFLPVAAAIALLKRHLGRHAVAVTAAPAQLGVTKSHRTQD